MIDKWPSHSRFTAIALSAYLGLVGLREAVLAKAATQSLERLDLLLNVILLACVVYWLERDTRQTRLMRVWDRGWFFCAWPVVVPYYLVKSPGLRKGLLLMLAWSGAYWAMSLVARGITNIITG